MKVEELSKFFDNVNQDILMILVHKVIKDLDTESLIRKFLQSGVMVEGVFQETTQNREKSLVKLGMPRWMALRNANARKGCMQYLKVHYKIFLIREYSN